MDNKENIHTYDNGFKPKEVKLKKNYKFYKKGFFYTIANFFIVVITKLFLFIPKRFFWGYRIVGRKNLKGKKGFLVISNHTHPMDAILISSSYFPKKFYVTMLESNLGFGIVSKYFRLGGATPIPTDHKLFMNFNKETVNMLKNNGRILFYPEAALVPYCDHIRPFMSGAFRFAVEANATIIPSVITYHKPKGFYKLTRRKKPCMRYNILPPYKIKDTGNKRSTIENTSKELHEIMSSYFNEKSDYFK